MAEAVWADLKRFCLRSDVDIIVVEVPQVYTGQQNKGDANDLIDLAGVDGAIAAMAYSGTEIIWYLPRSWKGTVPKPIHNKRVMDKLALTEKVVVGHWSTNHNVIDAIGIGKFHLNQKRKRA
jgi:hypothetical protein